MLKHAEPPLDAALARVLDDHNTQALYVETPLSLLYNETPLWRMRGFYDGVHLSLRRGFYDGAPLSLLYNETTLLLIRGFYDEAPL